MSTLLVVAAFVTCLSAYRALGAESTPGEGKPAAMSLNDLETLALERNPTLIQAAVKIENARGKAQQAGLYPNPLVGYEGEQMGLRGASGGERQGGFIQQEIVTAGKLRLSRAKYQQEVVQAEWQASAQQIRVLNAIRIRFYELLAKARLVEVHNDMLANAKDALQVTREMVNVGQANQPDLLQAEIEVNLDSVALRNAEKKLRASWEQLAAVVGAPELMQTPLTGQLEPDGPLLSKNDLLAQLLSDSPELQIAHAEIARDQITIQRERREPIPNILVRSATGYNFESRTTTTDLSLGFRLPLFDRNQGTIRQARADLARGVAELSRIELILRQRFADAYMRYETAFEEAQNFQKETLPRAKQAFELYKKYVQKDRRAAMPQMLVAERIYSQLREDHVRSLLRLREAEVEVTGLLLTDGLTEPPGPIPQGHREAVTKPR